MGGPSGWARIAGPRGVAKRMQRYEWWEWPGSKVCGSSGWARRAGLHMGGQEMKTGARGHG